MTPLRERSHTALEREADERIRTADPFITSSVHVDEGRESGATGDDLNGSREPDRTAEDPRGFAPTVETVFGESSDQGPPGVDDLIPF